MGRKRSDRGLLAGLRRLFRRAPPLPAELRRATDLVAAVDAGGIPLDATRVNRIARDLGLEVSPRAPVAETIDRIRAAVARGGG